MDVGRQWREWLWRGLGVVDGYGRRGEWGARWGLWWGGGGRGAAMACLASRSGCGGGWGVGVAYGQRGEQEALRGSGGEGEVDMGRRWRLGEQERRERGPGGSGWRLGEQERHEWVVEAWWRCGNHERRGWVRR